MNIVEIDKLITRFKEKYSDKYTYFPETILGMSKPMKVKCDCGNEYYKSPYDHLRYGCRLCGSKASNATRTITHDEYIAKAIAIWGDKYDLSETVYINSSTKIKVRCKIHGIFEISPIEFLREHGCQKCGGTYSLTNEEYIAKLKEVHGDLYDLSKVNFQGTRQRVTGICNEHGEFTLRADHFLSGGNCPACARLIAAQKTTSNTEEFKEKVYRLYGSEYDLGKVIYQGSQDPIIVKCSKGHEFKTIPSRLLQGDGCPVCKTSKGEKIIAATLEAARVDYKREFKVTSHFSGKTYRFDFFLPTYQIFIEFHGEQHYRQVDYFGGERIYKRVLDRDSNKIRLAAYYKTPLIVFNYKHLKLTREEFEKLILSTIKDVAQTPPSTKFLYEVE